MKVIWIVVCVIAVAVAVWIQVGKKETVKDYAPAKYDSWWGAGDKPAKEDTSIRPFTITVDNEMLNDLHARLKNSRYFTPILEENKWIRGTYPQFAKDLAEYWHTTFDWQKQVDYLNSYDHFITNIDGLDIHFIHVKAKIINSNTTVVPLLLLHGWPGSFFEFYGSIPYLTDASKNTSANFAFDIIVPSLPGFGFSEYPHKQGLNGMAITIIMAKLMSRLKYSSYVVQGGDYGCLFAKMMTVYDPEHCVGSHVNFVWSKIPWYAPIQIGLSSLLGPGVIFSEFHHNMVTPVSSYVAEILKETGYMHIQATRPYTLAHGLTDSPIGLAAYLAEKFYYWSDNGGDLYSTISKDQLLTIVMIYWTTNTISSSMNYYYEILGDVKFMLLSGAEEISAPVAIADYIKEIRHLNTAPWANLAFKNIVQYNTYEKGGHFAALEQPEIFSNDVRNFGQLLSDKYFK